MEDYADAVRSGFSALFRWHFRHGTRPVTAHNQGKPWTPKDLAYQFGHYDAFESLVKNVRNWLRETIPAALDPLEKAFFGDALPGEAEPYNKWRRDFRYAYAKAREQRDTEANKRTSRPDKPVDVSDDGHASPVSSSSAVQEDKLVLNDPRIEGRYLRATVRHADSLVAKFEKDEFLERAADQEFLSHFLNSGIPTEITHKFRWALVTGPAGAGKTRLAIKFLDCAEKAGFRVGFLELTDLKKFDVRSWRPSRPTFLVVDYATQEPDPLGDMLRGLSATAFGPGFEYPVRALLLEREANAEWFKRIAPMDSAGAVVRRFCYRENEKRWDYPLTPLSSKALLAIMRGRLPDGGAELSDEFLLDTLTEIDPPLGGADRRSAPRPLFAAATALKIADMLRHGDDTTTMISKFQLSKLQRSDVLAWIIDREREHFWIDGNASDRLVEKQRLRIHENLLTVATMALDVSRQRYDEECPDASREYLPDWRTLDEERFQRMSGGDPIVTLKRLEPDILGEFFVLDRLKRRPPRERQSLIDAGLTLGGLNSSVFLVRCAMDFPEQWHDLGFLKPSIPGPAMTAFVHAAGGCAQDLGREQFDDIAAVVSIAKDLADTYGNQELSEPLAYAILSTGVTLAALGRSKEAIDVYDELISRYGTASELALRRRVALALVHKGIALGTLGRGNEEVAVHGEVVNRYRTASEPALRELVANAFHNMCGRLSELGRNDEVIAACDEMVTWYGTTTDPALDKFLARVLVFKACSLGDLGRSREELSVCDEIVRRYGAATEPALCEQVINALGLKAQYLRVLGRSYEALSIYGEIVGRYGSATELVLCEQVIKALANKAATFSALGRSKDELAAYDEIVRRYGEAEELALRDQVARTLLQKGRTLYGIGRRPEAVAVNEDIVRRYGTADDATLHEHVAQALLNNALFLGEMGLRREELTTYDEIDNRFGRAAELALRRRVAEALVYKADRLSKLGRNAEAIATCNDIVGRYSLAGDLALREQLVKALHLKARNIGALGRSDEELSIYEGIVSRYATADELTLRELAASALLAKGASLFALGLPEKAIAACDDILGRYGSAHELSLRKTVAHALLCKGGTLGQIGRTDDQRAVDDDFISLFGNDADPQLRKLVTDILLRRYGNVSRNQTCPCGSGKRYKHCHGSFI